MKQILFALSIAILTLVIACSFGGPTDSTSDTIWPLAVGNEWQGVYTEYGDNGNVSASYPLVFKIVGDTTLDSGVWYFMEKEWVIDGKVIIHGPSLLINRMDGLYQRENVDATPFLKYLYPSKPGDRFITQNGVELRIFDAGVLIDCPRGLTRCHLYGSTSEDSCWRDYLSPGIGLIKIDGFWKGSCDPSKKAAKWVMERVILK